MVTSRPPTPTRVSNVDAGPGAVETYGGIPPYPETQEYLERVFRFRQEYLRTSLERGQIAFASRRGR